MPKNKPTILCVSRAYGEHAGGMERLSFELISSLKKDSDLTTLSVIHRGSRLISPLFVFTCIPNVLQKAASADVVHLGDPMLSFVGFVCKKFLRKKVAVNVHGLDITYPNPFYQLYLKLFFRNFDSYLPISRHVANLLEKHSIPSNRITVVNPGMHDSYYDPASTRTDAERLLNRSLDQKIMLYTNGRLAKRKGHAWFIKHVLPSLPSNVLYVISGTGKEQKNIEQVITRTNIKDRVLLLGRISEKESKTLYNTCDAFIQPNITVPGDSEGFGLVVLEAASCAHMVFAAEIEGLKDAIVNGKNGRLLPSGDAKQWIAALGDWITSGNNANRAEAIYARTFTLEKFSWTKQIAHYKTVLETLIATGK